MNFRTIALKNFKAHIQKYLVYFLCNSFAIMIFFMNSTLIFNKALNKTEDTNFLSIIYYISMTAVIGFSVFFITYAHSAFIRSRYREFGVFMTLGMTTKDIRVIIIIENVVIILGSLFAGLLSGVIFSRLFQLIVIRLLNLSGVSYYLSYKCFILTITVFIIIFAIVIIASRLSTRKLEIGELLKKGVKPEGNGIFNPFPGFIGIALIICSFILLYIIAGNKTLNTNPVAVLTYFFVCFSGVYLTISNMGKTIMSILKKRKGFYYKNLLTLTEINFKFNQNKKILFVLSILSSMIVFLVASPFSLYSQSAHISEMSQPNHLEYASLGKINNLPEAEFNRVLLESGEEVKSRAEIEFIKPSYIGKLDKYDLLRTKPVISEDTYNSFAKEKIKIKKGQAINIIIAWEPGYHGIEPGSEISFSNKGEIINFTVRDSIHSAFAVGISAFPASSGIVISNEDYRSIKSKLNNDEIGTFHIVNFKNWEKTKAAISSLKSELTSLNKSLSGIQNETSKYLKVASRLETYNSLKQGYSLFIFVTSVMGLLFFIAAGSVLYFKQYTEIAYTRQKFYKLYKLGISRTEVSKIISRELKLTFFIPLIFGGIMGYSFMYFMTYWVGGQEVMRDFMLNATMIVVAYFIFQTVFYLFTKNKYTKEVLNDI